MILGIMSDTHGNHSMMFRAARWLAEKGGAEWIYHAGDDYADAERLDAAGYKVRAVPGLWCPQYNDGRTPRTVLDDVDGLLIAMTHAEKDLRAIELAASVVIIGHTHYATVAKVGRSLHLNPGHLKADFDRGTPATFAILDLTPETLRAAIHTAEGALLQQTTIPRTDLT